MTAPDRGATYQIALASTGSSTQNAWYPAWRPFFTHCRPYTAATAICAPIVSAAGLERAAARDRLRLSTLLPTRIRTSVPGRAALLK